MNSFSGVTFGNYYTVHCYFSCRTTMLFTDLIYHFWKRRYEPFFGVGIFWIGLNPTDLGCWRLTLTENLFPLKVCFL